MIFQVDYDEFKLQKNSYDVISVTSSPLRHRKNRNQNYVTIFSQFAPSSNQNFWLRQWLHLTVNNFCMLQTLVSLWTIIFQIFSPPPVQKTFLRHRYHLQN